MCWQLINLEYFIIHRPRPAAIVGVPLGGRVLGWHLRAAQGIARWQRLARWASVPPLLYREVHCMQVMASVFWSTSPSVVVHRVRRLSCGDRHVSSVAKQMQASCAYSFGRFWQGMAATPVCEGHGSSLSSYGIVGIDVYDYVVTGISLYVC